MDAQFKEAVIVTYSLWVSAAFFFTWDQISLVEEFLKNAQKWIFFIKNVSDFGFEGSITFKDNFSSSSLL